ELREAIQLQPNFARAHTTLKNVLRQSDNADDAATETKEDARISAMVNNLQAATVATNSGKRLLSAGDIENTISQFRTAIHSEPKYAAAHYQLSLALRQSGQTKETNKEFQKTTELDPQLRPPGK